MCIEIGSFGVTEESKINGDYQKRTKSDCESYENEEDVLEEVVVEGARERHKGVYILPNLFTTGALFSGFYAIVAAMNGEFDNAAVAIFIAMILDGLDGRVARLTNTQSKFGEEYDSLSDMVSFGVAPALVAFSLNLHTLGNVGWIGTFIYVAGTALRLARFNTQIGSVDKRYFVGLPSPAAAALVAAFVWTFHTMEQTKFFAVVTMIVVTSAGILMVSNVLYHSFKDFDLKRRVPFTAMLIIVLVFAIISSDPPGVLLVGFLVYVFSGPALALNRKLKHNEKKQ
ncbi:MAG: CDP-diacylglycerol--serine O-phosphatidyltransferase [Proteobacteria bacterium]|nr:MAG: CDP-diacylglycerol--serine O-phosphatidyltransferase [Pseudomonadota bacterium]